MFAVILSEQLIQWVTSQPSPAGESHWAALRSDWTFMGGHQFVFAPEPPIRLTRPCHPNFLKQFIFIITVMFFSLRSVASDALNQRVSSLMRRSVCGWDFSALFFLFVLFLANSFVFISDWSLSVNVFFANGWYSSVTAALCGNSQKIREVFFI